MVREGGGFSTVKGKGGMLGKGRGGLFHLVLAVFSIQPDLSTRQPALLGASMLALMLAVAAGATPPSSPSFLVPTSVLPSIRVPIPSSSAYG